jgi:hypothetical protein
MGRGETKKTTGLMIEWEKADVGSSACSVSYALTRSAYRGSLLLPCPLFTHGTHNIIANFRPRKTQ